MGDLIAPFYTREQVLEAAQAYFHGEKLPATVFAGKYALRDKENNFYELTPADMRVRMAREFARIEANYPNALSEKMILAYLDLIYPQGSPMFGIGNPFQTVSLSNCAVLGNPQDTMSSILETGRDMANLYKRRFGVGTDLSDLRPEGASVNNAAVTSTGAWSFADLFSYITRMVGQSGRRGALMLTMDVRHPDIEKFIAMKADLTKVTGANVSVRVTDAFMRAVENDEEFTLRWPVEAPSFAEWCEESEYALRDIHAAKVERVVKARDVFNQIADQAAKTAEPGVLFWDTIQKNLPLDFYRKEGFKTTSTNPCGELPLCPEDSCRLISIFLPGFVRNPFTLSAYFDFNAFEEHVTVAQRLSDDLVDLELEALRKIRDKADTPDEKDLFTRFITKCEQGRRTGLGTHGLADALAMLGIKYDSFGGLNMAKHIYSSLRDAAYWSSVQMAKERGAFPIWQSDKDHGCEFFKRLAVENNRLYSAMQQYGRRNGALLTNAPTGSTTIISMLETPFRLPPNGASGIEPVFSLAEYTRNRKIDPNKESTEGATQDATGDWWVQYKVSHPTVALWRDIHGDKPLPDYFVDASQIDWNYRVQMQGIITHYIDHSVSSTLNLPRGTTAETVAEIYLSAWKAGCKGVTVYVDGSREQQVLSTEPAKTEKTVDLSSEVAQELSRANLRVQDAEQKFENLKDRFLELERRAGAHECLTTTHRPVETTGGMFKASFLNPVSGKERKVYVFVGRNDQGAPVEAFVIDQQGDEDLRPYAEALGRMTSLALKFGVPPNEVAGQLTGLKGGSISYTEGVHQSVPDLLAKQLSAAVAMQDNEIDFVESMLAPYTEEVQPLGESMIAPALRSARAPSLAECPRCEQHTLKVEGGCSQCLNDECGYSKCA